MELTAVRSSERSRYKRCKKAWYWAWRKGFVPREARFGALELGAWIHDALHAWYLLPAKQRKGQLATLFLLVAQTAIVDAKEDGAPERLLDEAEELMVLGVAMCEAYEEHWGSDPTIQVITAEIPLEFILKSELNLRGKWEPTALHYLKPDMVFADKAGCIWLMEHKTAKSIRTEHLVINDQGRPYAAMAERALRKAGVIGKRDEVKGVMYNFLRKALPDRRPQNDKGQYLNQDGSVSKKQPPPYFQRWPLVLTREQKSITLGRVAAETAEIAHTTLLLRNGHLDPADLTKTPHWSCPRQCEFWRMCVAEENGADISSWEGTVYTRQNPYERDYGTADEPSSFEMG